MNNTNVKNIRIINIYKNEFTDSKTGELVSLCRITYEIPQESTVKFVGSSIFEQQVKGINFDKLKDLVGKTVSATYKDKQDLKTRSIKSVISKINNVEL